MTLILRDILSLVLVSVATSPSSVDPAVLEAQADRVAVIDRAKESVVAIFASDGEGGGSGVVISPDGYALTNFHVARPCGVAMKCGLPDGRVYDAVIVGIDPVGDVALIKLLGRDDFPAAILGDSDAVRVGDWAYVMGNPFLLAADFQPTVTYGLISGVQRYQFPSGTLLEYADCIQTDASINPGNSGGPLFDAEGRLIGIVGRGSFDKRGRVHVGAGYAISINQAKNFLGHLMGGRIVDHATLGATVAFDQDGRVVVSDILESSDAYRRGLRYDDEIIALGGRPIETPNGFKNALGIYPKGWRIPLAFRRDGQRYDVMVRLAGVHSEGELVEKLEQSRHDPMPMPEREERPKLEDPDGQSPEDPRPPLPKGMPAPNRKEPVPEVVSEKYEQRRGYANYYFNRLHRDRVLQAWQERTSASGGSGATWILTGSTGSGSPFRLVLTGRGVGLELADGQFEWEATELLTESLLPEGSGGMMPALYLWHRLAVDPPEAFGGLEYLGTLPVPGVDGLADALVGLHRGARGVFFFDRSSGQLAGLEMSSDADDDPCEIRFTEYRDDQGRLMPGRIEVEYGDQPFTTLTVERFTTQP